MVSIPRRSPLQGSQLSTQAPAVRTQPGALSRTAEASQGLLQKVIDVAQRFENIQTLNETTHAKTIAQQRLAELQERAMTQPDIFDKKTLTDEIAKIKSETSASISLPNARNAFQFEYDGLSLMANTKIDATLRKRQVADSQVKMFDNLDVMKEGYKTASSPKEKNMVLGSMEALVNDHVALGLLTPTQGRAEKDKQHKAWIEEDIRDTIATDPETAIRMLEQGDFGDIGATETADFITVANSAKARKEKQGKKDKETEWRTNLGETNKNIKETSVQDYIDLMTDDAIDPDVARKMINYKLSPDSVEFGINETKKQLLVDMMDKARDPATDLIKFQESISNAVASGDLDPIKATELQLVIEPLFEKAIKGKGQPNPFSKAWSSSLDYIKQSIERVGGGVNKLYDVSTQFMTEVLKGNVEPSGFAGLARDLVKDQVRADNPATVGLDDVPNAVVSSDKPLKTVFTGQTDQKADVKLKEPKNDKDSFGFVIGEQKQGYEYIGSNEWQKI